MLEPCPVMRGGLVSKAFAERQSLIHELTSILCIDLSNCSTNCRILGAAVHGVAQGLVGDDSLTRKGNLRSRLNVLDGKSLA